MGLFDFLKRRSPPPQSGADLRETVISAASRGNDQGLAQLCRDNRETIRAAFPGWRTVPAEIRGNPASQDRYCQGLIAVATAFEQAGDPSLIALLMGKPDDNVLLTWERDLSQAQTSVDAGEPDRAVALLRGTLDRTKGLTGPGVDKYLPRTYGLLGVALYRAGDAAAAAEFTRKAKELCVQVGDDEGARVYSGNLRQMGVGSDSQGSLDDEVVFTDATGRRLTRQELANATGTIRWEVIGAENIPPRASALHAEARRAGAAGELDRALQLLVEAQRLAPAWPYPVYDAAFTHLLQGDMTRAEELYARVDAMAPRGFFTTKTALDCLGRERFGEIPKGSYLKLLSVEWASDAAEKRRIVEGLLAVSPAFPAAWKELAVLEDDQEAKLIAIDRGLACRPDPETHGILMMNRALVLDRRGERAAAVQLLGSLATDPHSTLATEHLAKATLARLINGSQNRVT